MLWIAYLALVRVAIEGVLDLLRGRITSLEGTRVLAVLPTLLEYAAFIGINATILIGWALYNYFRFHGPDRRRSLKPVTPEEVATAAVALVGTRRVVRTLPGWRGGLMRFGALAPSQAESAMKLFELQGKRALKRR